MTLSMLACSSRSPDSNSANAVAVQQAAPQNTTLQGAESGVPGAPGGLPDDKTALQEPKGAIDYKSAEAAGQLAQRYGGLLEQRKFAEARQLWGNGGESSGMSEAQFADAYTKYATIHSEVGHPSDMEGAAGSSYITVPFRLYGSLKSGGTFNRVGTLTMRRVNDVPGSTEAQRHWHIEKADLEPHA